MKIYNSKHFQLCMQKCVCHFQQIMSSPQTSIYIQIIQYLQRLSSSSDFKLTPNSDSKITNCFQLYIKSVSRIVDEMHYSSIKYHVFIINFISCIIIIFSQHSHVFLLRSPKPFFFYTQHVSSLISQSLLFINRSLLTQ